MTSSQMLPALDEATFQQMLEAAFVLQERNYRGPSNPQPPEVRDPLAEIAATQEVLRSKSWDVNTSAQLIAEQLQKITSAVGVAVAIIHDDQLEYCAAVGNTAPLGGMALPIDSGLSEFLRTAATDPSLLRALLKRHDSQAPFLFPVYHEGKAAGLLDVRFPACDAIPDREVQSCQAMAGLMGETIARVAKLKWKQALATERATMLDVLERLRPQLERLATGEAEENVVESEIPEAVPEPARERTAPEIEALLAAMSQAAEKDGTGVACGQCGYQFGERELFCGRCGTPRLMSAQPEFDFAEQVSPPAAAEKDVTTIAGPEPEGDFASENVAAFVPEFDSSPMPPGSSSNDSGPEAALALNYIADDPENVEDAGPQVEVAVAQSPNPAPSSTWTSASHALHWLTALEKSNSPGRIWLDKHRGDVAIALSALVLLVALTGWGLHPAGANTGRLTLFERMLVGLGVAEAPPPPAPAGNPNVWVWVDVHTALYYCPGAELYGKTAGGKFALQHDAQIDQFQPAERASCQ